jgi:hypothetical protein
VEILVGGHAEELVHHPLCRIGPVNVDRYTLSNLRLEKQKLIVLLLSRKKSCQLGICIEKLLEIFV